MRSPSSAVICLLSLSSSLTLRGVPFQASMTATDVSPPRVKRSISVRRISRWPISSILPRIWKRKWLRSLLCDASASEACRLASTSLLSSLHALIVFFPLSVCHEYSQFSLMAMGVSTACNAGVPMRNRHPDLQNWLAWRSA